MSFPSLETLCVSAATESTHWKLQRRYLERLPEHAANELLALLLVRQPSELRPATLELFRHCVTRLELRPPPPPGGAAVAGGGGGGGGGAGVAGPAVAAAITFGPDWAASLAGFNHLAELRMSGCSRLTVAALQALLLPAPATAKTHASAATAADNAAATAGGWQLQPPCRSPAAASLRRLDVSGCSRLGDEAAALMARCCGGGSCSSSQDGVGSWGPGLGGGVTAVAAGLVSLDISETSVTGAGLRHLSALTGLTELRAGGLKACSDADWCALLPHLPALRRLDAWGTDAGDGGDGGEQLLAVLATTGAAAAAAAADDGSSTVLSRGGGGCGSSSMGMHRLEQLSLAWTRVRVAPAFPALQVLDLRHCQLKDVWWPGGSGGAAPLPLRQLLLRGAVVSGRAAAAESGIAALVRHAAATLELLDLADVSAPTAAATVTLAGGGGGGAVWPLPLAALAGRRVDGSDSSGGGCGCGGGHGGGGAPRLTHLDISRTAVPAEQLEELQHAPALAKLVAAGCRGAGSARGAAALVSAGLRQLRELDLSAAGVGDDCVSWLQQLSSLTSLNLSGNTALSLAPPPPPPPLQPPAQEQGQQQQQQQQQQHQIAEAEEGERVDAMANVWRRDEGPAAAREEAGSSSRRSSSSSSGEGEDGCSSNGSSHVWPQLLRLNLLGTRVTEAGIRALLSALAGSGGRGRGPRGGDGGSGGGGGDVSRPPAASALEQLKLGGGGFTDGAAAVLAAARLPRLHSLLVRDAPLSGHGALLLAASGGGGGLGGGGGGGGGLTALRRLELQACWLVSPQDAARMADCMAATAAATAAGTAAAAGPPVLVVVNGKAAGAAAAAAPAGPTGSPVAARSGAASSSIATPAGRKAVAAAAAAAAARAGAVASAAAGAAAGDLSAYDQRLRYSRQELITVLAAAPLAGGGGGGAAGCSWPEELGDAPASATALWGRQPAVGAAAAGTAAYAAKAAAQTAAAARAAVVAVLPADLLRPVGVA